MRFRFSLVAMLIAVMVVAAALAAYRIYDIERRKQATVEDLYDKGERFDELATAIQESTISSLQKPKICTAELLTD